MTLLLFMLIIYMFLYIFRVRKQFPTSCTSNVTALMQAPAMLLQASFGCKLSPTLCTHSARPRPLLVRIDAMGLAAATPVPHAVRTMRLWAAQLCSCRWVSFHNYKPHAAQISPLVCITLPCHTVPMFISAPPPFSQHWACCHCRPPALPPCQWGESPHSSRHWVSLLSTLSLVWNTICLV